MARLVSMFCLLWCVAAPANIRHPGQLVLSTITATRLPVAVSFAYDLNGNMLTDGQRFCEWDDVNQLTAVTVSNSWRMEFVHDGLRRCRIVREYDWSSATGHWQLTNEVHYLCDGYVPMQERDSNNAVRVTYTRGLDLSGTFGGAGGIGGLLARTDGAGSAYYHADGGGNITLLTDSSGDAMARYLYEPFGRLAGKWGPMTDVNTMQFSSMPVHHLSGLSLYPFRYYDPTLQRWLNEDPVREAGGINLHRFVGNNPINEIDPLGLNSQIAEGSDGELTWVGPYDRTPAGMPFGLWWGNAEYKPPGWIWGEDAYGNAKPTPDDLAGLQPSLLGELLIPSGAALLAPSKMFCPAGRTTYLYQKVSSTGAHLKFGVTWNPLARYSARKLAQGRLRITAHGTRGEMLSLERSVHRTLPLGPEERQIYYRTYQERAGLRP